MILLFLFEPDNQGSFVFGTSPRTFGLVTNFTISSLYVSSFGALCTIQFDTPSSTP